MKVLGIELKHPSTRRVIGGRDTYLHLVGTRGAGALLGGCRFGKRLPNGARRCRGRADIDFRRIGSSARLEGDRSACRDRHAHVCGAHFGGCVLER